MIETHERKELSASAHVHTQVIRISAECTFGLLDLVVVVISVCVI